MVCSASLNGGVPEAQCRKGGRGLVSTDMLSPEVLDESCRNRCSHRTCARLRMLLGAIRRHWPAGANFIARPLRQRNTSHHRPHRPTLSAFRLPGAGDYRYDQATSCRRHRGVHPALTLDPESAEATTTRYTYMPSATTPSPCTISISPSSSARLRHALMNRGTFRTTTTDILRPRPSPTTPRAASPHTRGLRSPLLAQHHAGTWAVPGGRRHPSGAAGCN